MNSLEQARFDAGQVVRIVRLCVIKSFRYKRRVKGLTRGQARAEVSQQAAEITARLALRSMEKIKHVLQSLRA